MHSLPLTFALAAIAIVAGISTSGCSHATASREIHPPDGGEVPAPSSGVTRTGEVYLYRGLANVFSTGMDSLGAKMRARGMNVRVANHTSWRAHANDIMARAARNEVSYPLIIMGHSYGADGAVRMANLLGSKGIRVDYLVTFDLTAAASVGAGAKRVRNFYVHAAEGPGSYRYLRTGAGFRGDLENVNLARDPRFRAVHHFNIEKNAQLHDDILFRACEMTSVLRRR